MIVKWALVKNVFACLNGGSEPGFEPITFRRVDAARARIGLFVLGPHFLVVPPDRGVPAKKVEETCHTHDRDALKALDGGFS